VNQTLAQAPSMTRQSVRAVEGQKMWVLLNHIKADKCKQFEHFVHAILMPAAEQVEPELYRQVRVLYPSTQNEDGTFTYIFLMDPLIPEADYSFEYLLHRAYPPEKAEEYLRIEEAAYAAPQIEFEMVQSMW
jgi:hypothetical protein